MTTLSPMLGGQVLDESTLLHRYRFTMNEGPHRPPPPCSDPAFLHTFMTAFGGIRISCLYAIFLTRRGAGNRLLAWERCSRKEVVRSSTSNPLSALLYGAAGLKWIAGWLTVAWNRAGREGNVLFGRNLRMRRSITALPGLCCGCGDLDSVLLPGSHASSSRGAAHLIRHDHINAAKINHTNRQCGSNPQRSSGFVLLGGAFHLALSHAISLHATIPFRSQLTGYV